MVQVLEPNSLGQNLAVTRGCVPESATNLLSPHCLVCKMRVQVVPASQCGQEYEVRCPKDHIFIDRLGRARHCSTGNLAVNRTEKNKALPSGGMYSRV